MPCLKCNEPIQWRPDGLSRCRYPGDAACWMHGMHYIRPEAKLPIVGDKCHCGLDYITIDSSSHIYRETATGERVLLTPGLPLQWIAKCRNGHITKACYYADL